MLQKIFIFFITTAWISFVAMFSYNFYKPDIHEQSLVVEACLREIVANNIDMMNPAGVLVDIIEGSAHVKFVNIDSDHSVLCYLQLGDGQWAVKFIMQGFKTLFWSTNSGQ